MNMTNLNETPEQILYPEIASELNEMEKVDQEMRNKIGKDGTYNPEIDRKNTLRLKEIISQIGWPNRTKVGNQGMRSAWLLAQHADEDRLFQRECLELMKQESVDEIRQCDIAYLEDRVRVGEGGRQLYGTQFFTDERGFYGPRPIEDLEHVDERRAAVGLESIAEYEARMREIYKK